MITRLESDSIGTLTVPLDAYYGVHTLRAKHNFPITGKTVHAQFIISLAQIKKASALTNGESKELAPHLANAIMAACDEMISGQLHDQFIVDPIQGGAGTSFNMNANEVITNRAIELLGGTKGDYTIVHPNDHTNMSQSTNDVIPTAGKLTVLQLLPAVIGQLERLHKELLVKSIEFAPIVKVGRTQMQDAVPMTLGQSFHAYSSVVKRDLLRLKKIANEMVTINMGGTAIGTAINVDPYYLNHIAKNLSQVTGFALTQADDLIDCTQNVDGFVAVSSALKTCAVSLSKMANDLRLLSSGPKTGFGEINLPAKQNGSSIMPGKINPVIPEVMTQIAYNIIGNDVTITMAAEAGQLELNAFEPILFYNLFESLTTLANGIQTFVDNCIIDLTANEERCRELLENSVATVTALCPYIGYQKSAEFAKRSIKTGEKLTDLVLAEQLLTEEQLTKILDPVILTNTQGNDSEHREKHISAN